MHNLLWRVSLLPDDENFPTHSDKPTTTILAAFSAYDLPSVKALLCYFHAAARFSVQTT